MITKEQARVIFDLVQDIENDSNDLAHESYQGSYMGMEAAEKELKNSKAIFEEFIKSITL